MINKRLEKIAKELQRELSQIILYELSDPGLGFVTITKVEPAPDLKSARVFISVLGEQTKRKVSLDTLARARGYIQKIIAGRMKLRWTPVLSFCYDESIEKQIRLSKLIDSLAATKDDPEATLPPTPQPGNKAEVN